LDAGKALENANVFGGFRYDISGRVPESVFSVFRVKNLENQQGTYIMH
jgi:hypothetical protein